MGWKFSVAVSLILTITCSSPSRAITTQECQLDGQWYDPNISTRNAQFIFKFDKDMVFAVTPNLQWTTGVVEYYPSPSPSLSAHLDNGDIIIGSVNKTTCNEIEWHIPIATWTKIPNVTHVHVVFMNHLDIGYNGIPNTGFIINVLNVYFQEYFPRAIRLGIEMEEMKPSSGFIYTTHPWLLNLYLNCPVNFKLNDVTLYCPSNEEIQAIEMSISKGHITWHAGPMNMQIELMNEHVLNASMQIAKELDEKYNHHSAVLSQRDVPGITAGAIHTLRECGIKAVSVGVNPGSAPPAVPKIFEWKLNKDSKESVIAMWNAGGYPTNPGNTLSNAGGISLMDSVISDADGQALVFAFRTDNSGPPISLEEVHSVYDILSQQYEGANVFASTLDNFIDSINKQSLPTVSGEIGDTWIQGIASDPRKMALYRYGASALKMCKEQNKCTLNPEMVHYLRYLVKLPEHTWGLPSVYDTVNWTNSAFEKYRNEDNFQNCEKSWKEQRVFFNVTRGLSKQATNHVFSDFLEQLLKNSTLDPYPPSLDNYIEVDSSKTFNLGHLGVPINITFGKDGSISSLSGKDHSGKLLTFADQQNTLGTFTYHTYNQTDYDFVNSEYGYYGNAGYDKPNVTSNAHPESNIHHFLLKTLYQSKSGLEFCSELIPPMETLHVSYGAPDKVWNCIQFLPNAQTASSALPLRMTYKLSLLDKTSTRLPEATMFSFTPPLQTMSGGKQWSDQLFKVQSFGDTGILPTGGITLNSIVKNGSFYQHAVEDVYLIDDAEKLYFHARSIEVPLVCPIFDFLEGDKFKTPNPLPILSRPSESSRLRGFAFNIHNNVWNTNYPLWYPFVKGDENFRANFEIVWDKEQK